MGNRDSDRPVRRKDALGRYGEPEEVAHMVLNLALPASSFVNGAIIPKADWVGTPLNAEDKIELVTFVGGG